VIEIYNEREIVGTIPRNFQVVYPSESLDLPDEGLVITNYSHSIKYIHSYSGKKLKSKNIPIEIDAAKTTKAFNEVSL